MSQRSEWQAKPVIVVTRIEAAPKILLWQDRLQNRQTMVLAGSVVFGKQIVDAVQTWVV